MWIILKTNRQQQQMHSNRIENIIVLPTLSVITVKISIDRNNIESVSSLLHTVTGIEGSTQIVHSIVKIRV